MRQLGSSGRTSRNDRFHAEVGLQKLSIGANFETESKGGEAVRDGLLCGRIKLVKLCSDNKHLESFGRLNILRREAI